MNISYAALESVANLLKDGTDSAPIKEEIEWKGLDEEEAEAVDAVLDEVTWADMFEVAQAAARRLEERGPVDA